MLCGLKRLKGCILCRQDGSALLSLLCQILETGYPTFLIFGTLIHKLESSAVPSHVRFYEPYNSQLERFRLSVFRYHLKSMTNVHLIHYRDVRIIKVYELESYYHRSKPKEVW